MLSILPDNWKWLAPVTLTRKQPVPQFVINRALTESACFQPCCDLSNRFTRGESIDDWRINRNAIADETDRIFIARRLHHFADRQVEFAREFEITFIVRRHGVNRAGAITEQNVIGDPDRDLLVVRGIDRECSGENTGFFFRKLGPFEIAFARGPLAIFANCRPLFFGYNLINQRMFRRENQVSRAVDRVWAGCKNADSVAGIGDAGYDVIDLSALAASNPVLLEQFDAFGPVESRELVNQSFRICGDTQHPLPHGPANDRKSPDFTLAI